MTVWLSSSIYATKSGCDLSLLIAPLEALTDTRLSGPERRVLLALYSFRNKNADTVWPSAEAIAARSGLKDKTYVSKMTTGLAKKGWIEKKRRGYTGGNEYKLTVPEEAETIHSNLECEPNLDYNSNLEQNYNSNLEQRSNSNLDYRSKNKEHQSEHQSEEYNTMSESEISDPAPADENKNEAPEKTPIKIPPCPTQKIVDLYHEVLPELPQVRVLTTKRAGQIKARWLQLENMRSLERWRAFFEYVRNSGFLMGMTDPAPGRQRFSADLEWLTNQSNFAKIVEGKYHDARAA